MQIEKLTKETILEDTTFEEIIDEKDEIYRQRLINDLTDRAGELGVKTKFTSLLKAYQKEEKKMLQEQKKQLQKQNRARILQNLDRRTEFGSECYPDLRCGNWFADETGIRTFGMFGEVQACYHPILPVERFTNLETGDEKIKLAFKKGERWKEIICDKDLIASSAKIISLANAGVAVTSENAKYLVRYLADVENFNMDLLPEWVSTSKLGWHGENAIKEFVPYYSNIVFDGDVRFRNVYGDIRQCGNEKKWYAFVKKVRAEGRIEPRIMMAASFASVIIKMCNALPFFVHLHGQSEGGKTLCLMLAASIWGNPSMESAFTGDFLSTQTAIEVRADMLNHLPYIMDDTAQVMEKYKGDFSTLIYTMCSGNGKDRSNRSLGLNRNYNWHCAFLTTGELPITKEYSQAGAANRVIEVEAGYSKIFENGIEMARTLNENFGFAGKRFIEILQNIGAEEVCRIQRELLAEIEKSGKMQKQSISLSLILTADRIATDCLFEDGCYLSIEETAAMLKSEKEISENERCYEFIMGEVVRNHHRFMKRENEDFIQECWGIKEGGYIYIIKNVFDQMCRDCNYNSTAFLKWADIRGLLITDKGRKTKRKRFNDNNANCVCILEKQDESQVQEGIEGFYEIEEE